MLIYLLRHGETVYNAEKRYQGMRDVPLSFEGRAALHPPGFCPVVVYASPLCRAVETARILFPDARIQTISDLREMCFGDFEGRTAAEMRENPDYRAWVEGWCRGRCPGSMEDQVAFAERSCAAFAQLVDAALDRGDRYLVIVAHGGTQMAVLSRYGKPHRTYYDWQTGNASGFVLDAARWRSENVLTVLGEICCGQEA